VDPEEFFKNADRPDVVGGFISKMIQMASVLRWGMFILVRGSTEEM
jgi:hypothetical protein